MSHSISPRKGRGRRKPVAEINVVPYIDVTLVLLIIFMITTPLMQSGVDVDLPKAEAKEIEIQDDTVPIVVSITKQGQYYLSVDNQEEQIQPETITSRVVTALANKPNTPVFIKADNAINYGMVVTAMSVLKNAGVPNVGLMTEFEENK